jgi:hypothetical protein
VCLEEAREGLHPALQGHTASHAKVPALLLLLLLTAVLVLLQHGIAWLAAVPLAGCNELLARDVSFCADEQVCLLQLQVQAGLAAEGALSLQQLHTGMGICLY